MTTPTTKRYRMAAFDLDGTLLNSNHQLSDATVGHLRRLHSKGTSDLCRTADLNVTDLALTLHCIAPRIHNSHCNREVSGMHGAYH